MLKNSLSSNGRSFALAPIAAGLALVLSGCSFIPTYERPAAPVPAALDTGGVAVDPATTATEIGWREFVQDARLRELIALAIENNRDLRLATLNIEQVRAQYQIQRAGLFPAVNGAVTGSRQSSGEDTISSAYSAGLAMSGWEIDFFGRVASLKEAALAQYLASEEARNSAQTSLVAAVASSWLSLQTSDELLALTEQTLKTRQDSLRLTRLRFDSGVSSALDLRQAESLLASAQGTLAQQQRQRALDLNALTLLAGQPVPPSVLPAATGASQQFSDVPVGLSSEVLIQRADIRAAEQQLIAANANIGAARAAFFPRISLTASFGTASDELSGLFKSGSWGFSLAPQALLPIFDAGRNRAGLQVANAQRSIAVAQYEKAIQTAFREVSDALAGRATLARQAEAQLAQVEAESERFRLAELRYRNGIASFLDVLDAQRSQFGAQQALSQTRLVQRQNQVALYKALGGGWKP
ncbi:multidrug transporter [Hydrogenophaga crassostreae]|uniref:Multidrug transporter n=1 Tax=Hydrogenophaga crassostreae TaxID=1763535 RepID=A0A162Z7W6_9BURK|nr:efflux transporter outer membrane subunit [Hydrogenophaga crassostreae]AOW13813.1 multidrug transporter [Hydrogenophaga crassostreae]OAD44222.1 multidrug transporter [Hydrogenophaga crassostreae]